MTFYPYLPRPPFQLGPLARQIPQADVHRTLREASGTMDTWKLSAAKRYKIFTSKFHDMIADRIGATRYDKETRDALMRFASVSLNVAMDITNQVCAVWRHGARRQVVGASDDQNDALRRLLVEAQIDTWVTIWNRLAFLVGPIVVVPVMRAGRMRTDILRPDWSDHFLDPDDPMGTPIASAWPNSPVSPIDRVSQIVLDVDGWSYYATGQTGPIAVEPHGIGEYPGATLRMSHPIDSWYGEQNDRIVEVTVDVGVVFSSLQLVRKAQNHKLISLIGNVRNVAGQQKIDPEGSVIVDTGGQGTGVVHMNVHDFETSPDAFIKHIRFLKDEAIESFGIPGYAVTYDSEAGTDSGERLRITQDGLTEIREQQIPFAREFEHELVRKMVAFAISSGHRLGPSLPSAEAVRDGYRVQFPQVAKIFNDPTVEMAYVDWQIAKGLTSRKEQFRIRNSEITDEKQVDTLWHQYMDEESEWNDAMAARHMSPGADPSERGNNDNETAAQIDGRQGGLEKARRAVDDER